jgi:hypothetical protein
VLSALNLAETFVNNSVIKNKVKKKRLESRKNNNNNNNSYIAVDREKKNMLSIITDRLII